MRDSIIKSISTFFFVGYIPFISGTFASIVACFIIYFLIEQPFVYISITVITIIAGFLTASRAEAVFKDKDNRRIVIDEESGMFISVLFLPLSPKIIFLAFLLFRILDALKVTPANRFQHLSGSKGVMLDDIVAGIYTNVILQVVLRFAVCRIS